MASFIAAIISLTIGAVVMASVFIFQIKNTSTVGWTAAETTMWGLLSLVGIVGLLFGVLMVFGIY